MLTTFIVKIFACHLLMQYLQTEDAEDLTHYLMINQLNATAHCQQMVPPCLVPCHAMTNDHTLIIIRDWAVGYMQPWGSWLVLLSALSVFLNWSVFQFLFQILCPEVDNNHGGSVAVHRVLISVKMGGTLNYSLISTHFSISVYFLPF